MKMRVSCLSLWLVLVAARMAGAQGVNTLPADQTATVERAVAEVMTSTHVPSAVVGIVRDGRIVYTAAFGKARLEPPLNASPAMHYPIGSISKQFTAAALMLLVEAGRVSLDDPVARWFDHLTRAKDVTVRNLLSHTSGYRDYAPQDYTIPAWTKPTTAEAIVNDWATKPLDFEPGTEYQYSNTNFVLAGLILERVSGQPFWSFLKARVLDPLGLSQTIDMDAQHDLVEPVGYFRYALGPPRPAIIEANGWYFADGEIAMPVRDLLTWDVSVMSESLLRHSSYAAMESPTKLKNGKESAYGLALTTGTVNGHRVVSHGGEVGGFVASNTVYPDDRFAVAVFTNEEASPAASAIGRRIANALVPGLGAPSEDAAQVEAVARGVLAGLQQGQIDRALFTANANFYFGQQALDDFRASLSALGAIRSLRQASASLRGGFRYRRFAVEFANGTRANLSTYWTLDGKIEQFLLEPAD